jgi:hypothetical protein
MSEDVTPGARLRMFRDAAGKSRPQLAGLMGCSAESQVEAAELPPLPLIYESEVVQAPGQCRRGNPELADQPREGVLAGLTPAFRDPLGGHQERRGERVRPRLGVFPA